MSDKTSVTAMTNQELDAIRARCEAATPGEWYRQDCEDFANIKVKSDYLITGFDMIATVYADKTAEFIAHARADVIALLTEIERLQILLTMAKGDLAISCDTCVKQKICVDAGVMRYPERNGCWRWRGEVESAN